MPFERVYVVPIVVAVWFPLTFIITYAIALYNKNVTPIFPYISDTGTWSPESCIFGQMLNIGAIMIGVIVYVRFLQIQHLITIHSFPTPVKKYNHKLLILGMISSLGVSLVGNFQETNVLAVHGVGALAAFVLGPVYLCLQTYLSFLMYPTFGWKRLNVIKVVCAIAASCNSILTIAFGVYAFTQFTGSDVTKWGKNDGAYTLHLISTICEWITAFFFVSYFSLFAFDFKKFSISEPELKLMAAK